MNVKELREKNNLSQQELADNTGIPKDRIAKWEQGKGKPKAADSKILDKFFKEFVPLELPAKELSGYSKRTPPKDLTQSLLEKQNSLMEMQNRLLTELKTGIQDKVNTIDANLKIVAGKAEGLQFDLISGRNTVLKALARLEGKGELELLKESDNLKKSLAVKAHELSMKAVVNK